MSNIVFVLPSEKLEGINQATRTPSLGVAYLSGMLIKHGFSCRVIDMDISEIRDTEALSIIRNEKPLIVGISVNLFTGNSGLRLARQIKNTFGKSPYVIFGGAFPSTSPLKFLKDGLSDAVVIGEGEITLLEIMQRLKANSSVDFKDIDGLACIDNDALMINPGRQLNNDLDSLPFPAWNIFPRLSLYKSRSRKAPVAPLLTSRGCPFSCIYCSKDVFKSVFRPRSAESVIEEIDYLVRDFGIRQLDIMDDNFSLDRDRTEKILDLIIARDYNLAINLQLGVRADSIDKDLIAKMKRAGVYKIAFGVESGDPKILQGIKKQLDLKRVLESTLLAKKAGMIVYGFFMFGLPGDNARSMSETIKFALRMNPDIANFVITVPFPGTKLFDLVKTGGRFLIDTSNGLTTGFYGNKVFYEYGDLKAKEVLRYYKLAYKSFYLRISKILDLALSVRSLSELKWVIDTSFSIISPMLKKDHQ